jgi:hypothetical protein
MCPYLDKADPRCAACLSLRDLSRAFAYCAGQYRACQVYHKLASEQLERRQPRAPRLVAS